MAHLNIYVPDDVAALLKRKASRAKVPLSRYVLSLLSGEGPTAEWQQEYFDRVCGFLAENIEEPADELPEAVEGF